MHEHMIHAMHNMNDSSSQKYLLYFSLFFFLRGMKSCGVKYVNVTKTSVILVYVVKMYNHTLLPH